MIQNDDLLYLKSQVVGNKYKDLPQLSENLEDSKEHYDLNNDPDSNKETIPEISTKNENVGILVDLKLESNQKLNSKKYKVYPLEFKKKVIEEVN